MSDDLIDLADHDVRDEVAARLGAPLAGRPVILGPGVLAGYTRTVRWLGRLGCPVLVVATARGAGPLPGPEEYAAVQIAPPPTASITDEFRLLDRLVRDLPEGAVAAIEEFDPGRVGAWWCSPFVTNDEPVLGRPVLGGRPRAFLALEDKLLAEQVWVAAGVAAAPHRVVPLDADALAAASDELATDLGVVWSGDARDGFNGGGNYVRWVRDIDDRARARGFFLPRCDRVRVMPFLEGVPCSIHGFVMPDGTAVLRPVEIATLRDEAAGRLVYGGLSSWWDPDPADREEMRAAARRVGEHLRAAYGYRGAFGVDGVLTDEGFRPTELNTRMAAGLTAVGSIDLRLLSLLQLNLMAGIDTGLSVAEVESVVPLLDEHREGHPLAVADGVGVGGADAYDVAFVRDPDGTLRLERAVRADRRRAGAGRHPDRVLRQGRPLRVAAAGRPAGPAQRRPDGPPRPRARRRLRRPHRRSETPDRFLAMRVVVVGGGLGGLASAARLAKLGHEVTLVEGTDELGGALTTETVEGFAWDRGAHSTLLPAVLRDLFRKSGRPIEREVELEPVEVLRHHRFADGSEVRLPGGSRARQLEAFDALGPGLGQAWLDHVATYADTWEVLRRHYLEVPWTPSDLPRELARVLDDRETLHRRLRRSLPDERLRLVAGHRFVAEGHDLRNVPAWLGLHAYLEQRLGCWTVPGGFAAVTTALAARMATRRVTVLTGTAVHDLVLRGGRCVGVLTAAGTLDADAVVVAVDPRRLPALAPHVRRTTPAIPPVVTHLGLVGPVPDVGHELVLHGDPVIVVRGGGRAPEGHAAWTLHGRGQVAEDLVTALARHHIDVRDRVVVRVDRSPRDQVEGSGTAMGVLWEGRGTVRRRLGPHTPIPHVYAAGAHATPGGQVPFVGLSAALVAQVIGPA